MIQEEGQRILDQADSLVNTHVQEESVNEGESSTADNAVEEQIIDPIKQLTQNQNPIPLLAILDRVDLDAKTQEGIPLLNLLCKMYLPLASLLQDKPFNFATDRDGRTPLHYAVEADDIKAVYECLKKGAKNTKDNFGNTPIMDAVKFGHRRSFLLCIHFQHLNDSLPHIAARYNRVWELRALQSLGFDLWTRDQHSMTPLDTAIESYSYEASEYLAKISPYSQLPNLRALTDSEAMIRRIKRVRQQKKMWNRVVVPLLFKIGFWLLIFIAVQIFPCFELSKDIRIKQLSLALVLYGMIWVMGLIGGPANSRRGFNSILTLLKQPYFPTMGEVCASCMDFADPELDHCDQCKTCVPKFHQHTLFCINSKNELAWYIYEFYWAWLLTTLFSEIFNWRRVIVLTTNEASFKIYELFLTLDYAYQMGQLLFFAFLIILAFIWLQQCLFCLQLLGMAFMNRTYQQVTHSEDYPHLYEAYKSKDNKIRLKQFRIFMRYKLIGGFCVGIKNILLYFL